MDGISFEIIPKEFYDIEKNLQKNSLKSQETK
jgi:hypothetical protein